VFDAHCHLDRCDPDPGAALQRAQAAGVHTVLVAGVDPEGWEAQAHLAGDGVLLALGLHPWAVAARPHAVTEHLSQLSRLLNKGSPHVVAVGETGLDHGARIDPDTRTVQERAFRAQVRMAHDARLPLVLHIVSAHEQAIAILKQEGVPAAGGMVHAFSGSEAHVAQYLALDLHLSFCGTVTNPAHKLVQRAIAAVPISHLLVETDAPDQTPLSRRPAPNEPAFLIDVIAAAARLRGESREALARTTAQNAEQLFCRN
jgi:TatD DNase family protein